MSSIDFSGERFKRIKDVYSDWWAHKGKRPVVGLTVADKPPKGREPETEMPMPHNVSLLMPVDKAIDAIEYEYSRYSFYGDAFPMFDMACYGPGIVAAFLGARLDNSTGSAWFFPMKKEDINEFDFVLDEDNPWFKYILKLCKKSYERFGDSLLMGMPDLGGILDILSTFFPGEELLFHLYDNPERVKYLADKLTGLWKIFYDKIAAELHCAQTGYTDWSRTYSVTPTYVIQCDFSYMISNEMFKEFALPSVSAQCGYLDNTLYHLDGHGELPHLDTLLNIERLKAVQWAPGSNGKALTEYPEIFQKIAAKNKGIQVLHSSYETLETIMRQTGKPGLAQYQQRVSPAEDAESGKKWLKRLGVEI